MAVLAATAPLVGIAAAMLGRSNLPMWGYAGAFSMTLAAITWAALTLERTGFNSLGLVPTRARIGEFLFGFVLSVVLFAALALVRGATVAAVWTFAGAEAVVGACAGIIIAFLLFFPEELLFRGYAFQRLVKALGVWPAILTSSVLFGVYHVAGSGMWGIGAFFTFAMPALGGVVWDGRPFVPMGSRCRSGCISAETGCRPVCFHFSRAGMRQQQPSGPPA